MTKRRSRPRREQRRPENLFLSLLVDLGATYHRVFGPDDALDFLRSHSIPPEIADRITSQYPMRRLTVLEQRKGLTDPGATD